MNFRLRPAFSISVLVAAACGLAGCKKPFVRVYLAPKDASGPITYKLPPGWKEGTPNSVSLVAFSIKSGGEEAGINVTPLPNLAGREQLVVNMWREQAGLAPVDGEELEKALEPVPIGGEQGRMFEVLGAREGGAPLRIVTAFFHTAKASWFFKMTGDEALVTAQKPAFVEFLKSVRVSEEALSAGPLSQRGAPDESSAPASNAAPPAASSPAGEPPAGWTVLAPGNMQIAKFAVPEKDGAKAEVSVSVFESDTGGTLKNVNRWRTQVGLGETDEAGLPASVKPLEGANGAVLVDLKNDSRALLGAIVPRDGQWYFYKLLGDAAAVEGAREQFVAYAKGEAQ